MVRIKSSQKFFTEDEVADLTGISAERLQTLARNTHLGVLPSSSVASAGQSIKMVFSHSELMILNVLHQNCRK